MKKFLMMLTLVGLGISMVGCSGDKKEEKKEDKKPATSEEKPKS